MLILFRKKIEDRKRIPLSRQLSHKYDKLTKSIIAFANLSVKSILFKLRLMPYDVLSLPSLLLFRSTINLKHNVLISSVIIRNSLKMKLNVH